MAEKITKTCSRCGGRNITVQAPLIWSETQQAWSVSDPFDYEGGYCHDCDLEIHIDDLVIGQQNKVNMHCSTCGSDNVCKDAWAIWDTDLQRWVLGDEFPENYCHECADEASLIEKPLMP